MLLFNTYFARFSIPHPPHAHQRIYLQAASKASLDQLLFTTVAAQSKLRTDNSYVYERYINRDTGESAVCYGRIASIISHKLYPTSRETHVLIECDWYSPTGVPTPSGLVQVSYDAPLSKTNRWTFLKDMYRANVMLWPALVHTESKALEAIPDTFVVLEHTAPMDDEDNENSDENSADSSGDSSDDNGMDS